MGIGVPVMSPASSLLKNAAKAPTLLGCTKRFEG
jgi:hypothetical protein